MIKLIEHNETKLRFSSYPNLTIISYIALLAFMSIWLYWCTFFSPIASKLTCQKTFFNRVDCQLQESSMLNYNLTNLNIKNLREPSPYFSSGRSLRLKFKGNSGFFNLSNFSKNYYYPSSEFALVNFIYFNPLNWFYLFDRASRFRKFIRGKSPEKSLVLELKLNWFELLVIGFFTIDIPIFFIMSVIKWFFTASIKNIYEFDGINKSLTVTQKTMFQKNITKEYGFERINRVILYKYGSTNNLINGRIILQFNPEYDYPIDEFINKEYGERNFQIIQDFIKRHQ